MLKVLHLFFSLILIFNLNQFCYLFSEMLKFRVKENLRGGILTEVFERNFNNVEVISIIVKNRCKLQMRGGIEGAWDYKRKNLIWDF